MSSVKISNLPSASAVTNDDLFVIVNDPSGAPVTQKVTAEQLLSYITGSTFNTLVISGNISASTYLGLPELNKLVTNTSVNLLGNQRVVFALNNVSSSVDIALPSILDAEKNNFQIGLIAQEVETVLPELVYLNGVKDYKSVRYPEMVAVLIEGVKELTSEINILKSEIEILKSGSL